MSHFGVYSRGLPIQIDKSQHYSYHTHSSPKHKRDHLLSKVGHPSSRLLA